MIRSALVMALFAIAASAQAPARWRLVEEWRVGGDVDGPHSFGDVRGMAVLPNGGIVLVDAKDQQVHFLDAKGQPVRTVGRKGAGPGEFQAANGLAVSPSGTVIVNDPSNNRFTLLAPNGDLLKTIPIIQRWGYGYLWDAFYIADGRLEEYVSVRKPGAESSISARRIWSTDFAKIDTILPRECPNTYAPPQSTFRIGGARAYTVMSIPYLSPSQEIARERRGAVWSGRYPGYSTLVRTPRGSCEPDVTITLRSARVPVPETQRDSQVERVRATAGRYGVPTPDLGLIPREYPEFDRLHLDASERLWVERHTAGRGRRFDVFSAAGRPVAEIESPAVFTGYKPVVITNDRVLAFVRDEDDVPYLVAYRIAR